MTDNPANALLVVAGVLGIAIGLFGNEAARRFPQLSGRIRRFLGLTAAESNEAPEGVMPNGAWSADSSKHEIAKLWQVIDKALEGNNHAMEHIAILQQEQARYLREDAPQINCVDAITSTVSDIARDSSVLLQYCADSVLHQMVWALLRSKPSEISAAYNKEKITDAWLDDQVRMSTEYVSFVSMQLGGTRLASDVRLTLQNAEADGNRIIGGMPDEKRPTHINPYRFLQYGIARTKYEWTIKFLEEQQRKQEDLFADHIKKLNERLRAMKETRGT